MSDNVVLRTLEVIQDQINKIRTDDKNEIKNEIRGRIDHLSAHLSARIDHLSDRLTPPCPLAP